MAFYEGLVVSRKSQESRGQGAYKAVDSIVNCIC